MVGILNYHDLRLGQERLQLVHAEFQRVVSSHNGQSGDGILNDNKALAAMIRAAGNKDTRQ